MLHVSVRSGDAQRARVSLRRDLGVRSVSPTSVSTACHHGAAPAARLDCKRIARVLSADTVVDLVTRQRLQARSR
jgi:hypothetical protein